MASRKSRRRPEAARLTPSASVVYEHATYVRDRIADGSPFPPGALVEQQWTVRNAGAAPWGAGYELALLSGDRLGESVAFPVPPTPPGAEAHLPLTFTAPATPGAYRSYWKLRNPQGEWFGERLWVDIRVEAPVAKLTAGQGNKLGFYLHLSTDQHGLWEAIRRVQPPVLLIHADTANTMLLDEIRRFRAPDAFVIGRLYKDVHTQRQILERDDPETQGRLMAEEILNYNFGLATKRAANGRLLIDAWMSLNEAVPGPASEQFRQEPAATARLLNHYDRFQVAFRQRLQAAGVEAVAFNFGAGNFGSAAHYLDHFPQTLAEYIYLGFHEYGWPTLYPAAGSATSAATYRACMDGIRTRYGDRHRVIISEAGLTRMYQNPAWGDVGWLNAEAPLTEEQYWQSLSWYNGQLTADDYVVGACLYEVGHHGDWASFRHLGADNHGHPIGLMDRLVALKDGTQARGAQPRGAAATPQPTLAPVTIRGVVTGSGHRIAGAMVQLIGDEATLGTVQEAAVATGSAVTWTRALHGYQGSIASCWRKHVAGEVAGLTYAEFKALVGVYNGSLVQSEGNFVAAQHYVLPENPHPVAIVWDRPLAGFRGSIWACWQQCVEKKVVGLTYQQFKRELLVHNPHLTGDELSAQERYSLPRNAGQREYLLTSMTGARGQFTFAELPAGDYRLEVRAAGYWPFSTGFATQQDLSVPVTLQSVTTPTTRSLGSDFITIAGDEFVRNERPFRFVGANIRGLVHYGDNATLPAAPTGHRLEQLRAAYDAGCRVVRIFLPSIKANVDQTITRLGEVIELVKQHFPDLYLLPALANLYADVPLRVPGDDHFYRDNLLVKEFFTHGYRDNYLPLVRRTVERFRGEGRILAWEIGNELKLDRANKADENDPNPRHYIDFVHTVAAFIRSLDHNHLITTGMISTRHAWLFSPALKRQLYASPHLDFVTIHAYQGSNEEDDSPVARDLGMPFIVEEAGFDAPHGQDRSGRVAGDMDKWFGLGARGYLQWGFMATTDNGDGDRRSGMDRVFHSDWDGLVRVYRDRAAALTQVDPAWRPPAKKRPTGEEEESALVGFAVGETVFAQDWLNIRSSPGHLAGNNLLGLIAPGTPATITGAPVTQDGLTWYPLQTTLTDGTPVAGWGAQANSAGTLLAKAAPPPVARGRSAARAVTPNRQQAYTQTYVNLRRDPGYVGKPGDHVIGEITHGAPLVIIAGPQSADGLTWWQVRAPLPDNRTAEGWVAEVDPNGIRLIDGTPPPPPTEVVTVTGGESANMPGYLGRPFVLGSAATVVAAAANLRQSAGLGAAAMVIATVERGTKLPVLAGPQAVDGLDWMQVEGKAADGRTLQGWAAIAAGEGQRLLAPAPVAAAIRLGRLFQEGWGLTQGWGSWPEFYIQFVYDGVPLKGHNGLDFGTSVGTQLLAADEGTVTRVDYEHEGFGNFLIITHSWGETLYAHLDLVEVAVGTPVASGAPIARAGDTGAGAAHLHFGMRIFPYRRTDGWGGFCDPTPFMDPTHLVGSRSPINQPTPMAPELPGRRRP